MALLTGTGPLLKASIKQNRKTILPWVMIISVLSASSIIAYRIVFPDLADRQGLAAALSANPAMELIFGPANNLLTNDGFNAWRAGQLGSLFAALMTILLVVKNSRADEDSGQAELIASGVISRQARLAVPILMSLLASFALFVVCFLMTWISGGEVEPSLLISANFAGVAFFFASVAAITAQLASDARTANSLAMGIMGVLYVARGYFDSSQADEWTQWLTPFGWVERASIAADNIWTPLPLFFISALVLVALALMLQQYRDFGQGLIAPRPAPEQAPRMGIFGLSFRLPRGLLTTWLVSFALLGVVFGNLATSVGEVFASNPALQMMMAKGATSNGQLIFGFITTIMQIVGIIAAIAGAQVMMRVRTEETEYRLEPLLSASLSRVKYFASNVVIALDFTACAMLVCGVIMGAVASHGEEAIAFADVVKQAAVTIPAVWVLNGFAIATVGARPQIKLASWAVIVATFAITLLGPTFKFPDWALGISPLHHIPSVVATDPSWGPVWVLGAIAAVLTVIGFVGFRRRDVG